METKHMRLISLYVSKASLKVLDRFVEAKIYPNRSEAIREAIRDLINSEIHFFSNGKF